MAACEMNTKESLSSGCFVYKRNRLKESSTSRQSAKKKCLSSSMLQQRLDFFCEMWEIMETSVQSLQFSMQEQVFDGLVQFVENAAARMHQWRNDEIIPAATLVTGVNMPDHETTFSVLYQTLVTKVTPFVVLLSSKDAVNLNLLVSLLVFSLRRNAESELKLGDYNLASPTFKRIHCNMPSLARWYSSVSGKSDNSISDDKRSEEFDAALRRSSRRREFQSPQKLQQNSVHSQTSNNLPHKANPEFVKPIVIVLRDVEGFRRAILQDFILILSHYFDRLPFILIFGISTSVAALRDILNQSASARLAFQTFTLPGPGTNLDAVLQEILLTDRFQFKLGNDVFKLLEEIFLYCNFSVETFLTGIKYCFMEHCYTSDSSILCCDMNLLGWTVDHLDHDVLEVIRKLGSFRKFVEKQQLKEQKSLLLDDDHTKTVIKKLVSEVHNYHSEFFAMLGCLHAVTCNLPKFPLGTHLRQLYSICLEKDVFDTEEFCSSMKLIRTMSRDELITLLRHGCDVVRDHESSPSVSQFCCLLNEVVTKLESLETQPAVEMEIVSDVDHLKSVDRFNFRKRLKERSNSSKQPSRYASLRDEAVNVLTEASRKFLKSPKQLPLYEVFYYNDFKMVQQHFVGGSRTQVQLALSDPQSYLKCDCCKLDEEGSIQSTLPDICVLYKLHLECGRLINLYDWLQAFLSIVEQKGPNKVTRTQRRNFDNELMVRFIRTVAELQFLGFIKETRRKTDHVARLTW